MTPRELLTATGNIWRVQCWRDGNRRRKGPVLFFRASNIIVAEERARRKSGCKCVDARPWDPRRESCFGTSIQEVE
jgi:hypothetical protein